MRIKLSACVFGFGFVLQGTTAESLAQTVQLPTFNMTGVSTTVLVPDRGQTFLGGINSASSSANQFGVPLLPGRPFGNRASGSDRSAVNFWARVWIHDFDAMDQMLLEQAAAERGGRSLFVDAPYVAANDGYVAAESQRKKSELVQLLTRDTGAPEESREAADLQLVKARELAATGKPGVARIYYQMALRRSTGSQRGVIAAELAALDQPATASQSSQLATGR